MSLDQIMIRYTAPTLCGIKPGNLFTVKKTDFSQECFSKWKKRFKENGISVLNTESRCGKIIVITYNVTWVRLLLEDSFTRAFLASKGYSHCNENFCAQTFMKELSSRIKCEKDFPHEVGIILGYPITDVIEFDLNKGRDCKYCGYWKSYSDIEKAKKCQTMYRECSEKCSRLLEEGFSLPQIIKEYKRAA